METFACVQLYDVPSIVLTVPMRNGNYLYASLKIVSATGSYRTYEEWKLRCRWRMPSPRWHGSYRTYEEWKPGKNVERIDKILGSYRTYEEWKPKSIRRHRQWDSVLTVPMRNGNWVRVTTVRGQGLVLTVPMRNGNSFQSFRRLLPRISSYRTYEEWKLVSLGNRPATHRVLTVPMRNGNRQCISISKRGVSVLTVPMRNGNAEKIIYSMLEIWEFLPYLWGMETLLRASFSNLYCRFLPYLWGMETRFQRQNTRLRVWFLPYLWGMETT